MSEKKIRTFIARTPAQLALLMNFRYRYYVVGRDEFSASAVRSDLILLEDADHEATNIAAEIDGEIVGSARINWSDDPGVRYLRDALGIQEFLEQRSGSAVVVTRLISSGTQILYPLLTEIIRNIEEKDVDYVFVNTGPGPATLTMYQAMGFQLYREGVPIKELGACDVLYFDVKKGRSRNAWYQAFAA